MVKFRGKFSPEFGWYVIYNERKKMLEDIERIIVETEEGEEIATIINDDEIDEAIIVADGYTVRIRPKAN